MVSFSLSPSPQNFFVVASAWRGRLACLLFVQQFAQCSERKGVCKGESMYIGHLLWLVSSPVVLAATAWAPPNCRRHDSSSTFWRKVLVMLISSHLSVFFSLFIQAVVITMDDVWLHVMWMHCWVELSRSVTNKVTPTNDWRRRCCREQSWWL